MAEAFTFERADELSAELKAHDHPDTVLLDGLTAAAALELVVRAPKSLGPPIVTFDGRAWASAQADREAQFTLFD